MSKLIGVFSDWMENGIFHSLDSFNVPWKNEDISDILDIEYFGNISGSKTISPLVRKLLGSSSVLSSDQVSQLARIIYNMNGANWAREYATLNIEYNPINNYDMTETYTENVGNSEEKTNTGTQGVVESGSNQSGVYGFNSSNSVGANDGSASTNSTRTDNLTENKTGEETREHELSRSGNIGVTTTQQMLESERNLYLWNFFYKVVFPSVDKVLTIATYSATYTPDVSTSGGGSDSRVMEKLDEISEKLDTMDGKLNTIDGEVINVNTSVGLVNDNVDESTLTIQSDINSIESSILDAIGDVTTNNY